MSRDKNMKSDDVNIRSHYQNKNKVIWDMKALLVFKFI